MDILVILYGVGVFLMGFGIGGIITFYLEKWKEKNSRMENPASKRGGGG